MNTKPINRLLEKYPAVFKDLDHLECGNGWEKILDSLAYNINILLKQDETLKLQFSFFQIKQKYGVLTIYRNAISNHIGRLDKLIKHAKILSKTTCEECGEPGILREQKYWIQVKCNKCDEKDRLTRERKNKLV